MQRLMIGLGAALVIAVVVVGVVFLSPQVWTKSAALPPTTAEAALKSPLGEMRNRKDPGEEHYIQGRYPEAIEYWIGAAAKGSAYAAHRLGVEYMDGKPGVVQRDYAKSMQYHTQAARAGISLSMFDLGSLNEFGNGVEKSMPLAARWYGHSANYGLAQGQYNYATILESGDGVPRDDVEALKFFILAARGGFSGVPFNAQTSKIDQKAATPAQSLEERITKEQAAEGRQRADSFHAASGPLQGE